jgi:iron complex transport system ATP-binding protein
MQPVVELNHVSVARSGRVVLHDINLSLEPGQHLVILGPNGCGKSTLLKTLTCDIYPLVQQGSSIRLFGRARWDLTELRKKLGVVQSELPGRQTLQTTGFDAILTGFFSSSTLWPNLTVTSAMRDRAEEVLATVGGESLRDRLVGEMSAGQQRRVMIGRALAASAQMLLLDEPSNALDLAAQQELRHLLRSLAQQGTALLLITHQLSDIIPEMERVLMMQNGRIIADGHKRELLTQERLGELFGVGLNLAKRQGFYHVY